jgi:hypothetical protein
MQLILYQGGITYLLYQIIAWFCYDLVSIQLFNCSTFNYFKQINIQQDNKYKSALNHYQYIFMK